MPNVIGLRVNPHASVSHILSSYSTVTERGADTVMREGEREKGNKGKPIHDEIAMLGMLRDNIVLVIAVKDMYAKCGAFTKARQVLCGLAKRGNNNMATLQGSRLPYKGVVSVIRCRVLRVVCFVPCYRGSVRSFISHLAIICKGKSLCHFSWIWRFSCPLYFAKEALQRTSFCTLLAFARCLREEKLKAKSIPLKPPMKWMSKATRKHAQIVCGIEFSSS